MHTGARYQTQLGHADTAVLLCHNDTLWLSLLRVQLGVC